MGSNWDLWRNFAIFRLLIFGIRNLAPEESVENLIRLLPDSKQRRFRSGTSFSFLIKILNMIFKYENRNRRNGKIKQFFEYLIFEKFFEISKKINFRYYFEIFTESRMFCTFSCGQNTVGSKFWFQ